MLNNNRNKTEHKFGQFNDIRVTKGDYNKKIIIKKIGRQSHAGVYK